MSALVRGESSIGEGVEHGTQEVGVAYQCCGPCTEHKPTQTHAPAAVMESNRFFTSVKSGI